ncbi:hypothetical protein [Modestobacter sp. I12A-02662]|uniref:hypothetical protein n=1 Tax=Modestobacter sp. I12A-02662 TaxID=1730496 RepID=UPI0034DF78A8
MSAAGADWFEQARRLLTDTPAGARLGETLGGLLGTPGSAPADHSAECSRCPLCAALATLRGRRPELLEALADVLATTATVLRDSAAAGTRPGDDRTGAAPDPTSHLAEDPVSQPAPTPVQRIEVA